MKARWKFDMHFLHEPIAKRIWRFVKKARGCWEWYGARSRRGYGVIMHEGKTWRASRLMWTLFRGPIPKGMKVCHSCDNTACVRLSHLFLGSTKINNADMRTKKRHVHGVRCHTAKLTEMQVLEIRAAPKHRGAAVILAKRYGVSREQISNVFRGVSWKHLPISVISVPTGSEPG